VSIDLGIQHAILMRHIGICSLPGSKIICDTNGKIFEKKKKKKIIVHKMCALIFTTIYV